jgi:hypothetical protein
LTDGGFEAQGFWHAELLFQFIYPEEVHPKLKVEGRKVEGLFRQDFDEAQENLLFH